MFSRHQSFQARQCFHDRPMFSRYSQCFAVRHNFSRLGIIFQSSANFSKFGFIVFNSVGERQSEFRVLRNLKFFFPGERFRSRKFLMVELLDFVYCSYIELLQYAGFKEYSGLIRNIRRVGAIHVLLVSGILRNQFRSSNFDTSTSAMATR